MISKIGVENNNINSIYSTQSKQKDQASPSFNGVVSNALVQFARDCEKRPMLNVAIIDLISAIIPRTVIETCTNIFAGFEALRREGSGLLVNCLIPGFIALGTGHLINNAIMPKGTNMAGCWADSNMLEKLAEMYKNSSSKNKVHSTFEALISNMEGVDGDKTYKFTERLTKEEISSYANRMEELKKSSMKRKAFDEEIKKIADEITSKTHIGENLVIKGEGKALKASNLENVLGNSVKFFTEFEKADKNIGIEKFAKQSKKLVRGKSLMGLAIVLPLAASMQYINRAITRWLSGVKGAPIYKDYGKEDSYSINKESDKKGLLKQKIISMSSMLGVGLLSMMKMPSLNILEFKGRFPTMDQARIISTTTFMSRMAVAEDKHELAEATVRDIATFLSLYFLGDYAAKAVATVVEKKKGIKLLNHTVKQDKDANVFKKAWHWFKHTTLKSSQEVFSNTAESLKEKGLKATEEQKKIIEKELQTAKNYRATCQIANLGVSLLLLGLIIPYFTRKNTEKKHAEEIEQMKQQVSSEKTEARKELLSAS